VNRPRCYSGGPLAPLCAELPEGGPVTPPEARGRGVGAAWRDNAGFLGLPASQPRYMALTLAAAR
jgi:hypothetical protein